MPFIQWPSFTKFYSNFTYHLPTDGKIAEGKRSSTMLGKWFHAKPQGLCAHMKNNASKNTKTHRSLNVIYRFIASEVFFFLFFFFLMLKPYSLEIWEIQNLYSNVFGNILSHMFYLTHLLSLGSKMSHTNFT